jgi:hypothetical protein
MPLTDSEFEDWTRKVMAMARFDMFRNRSTTMTEQTASVEPIHVYRDWIRLHDTSKGGLVYEYKPDAKGRSVEIYVQKEDINRIVMVDRERPDTVSQEL